MYSQRGLSGPSLSTSSYDEEIVNRIRFIFVQYVIPSNVLYVFHKYDHKILVRRDIEEIRRLTDNKGDSRGAEELLDRLSKYKNWYPCLLKVLRDPCVMMAHVADQMEEILANNNCNSNIAAEVDNNLEGPESAPALEVLKLQEKLKEVSIATRDECMVSLEIVQAAPQANLKTIESRCLNINNHERFFRAENFPAQCLSLLDGDRLGINMLESAFDLVVKIEIRGTSQDQPTGTSRCATGSNVLIFGSGMIQDVYSKSTSSGQPCSCSDCQRSRKPKTEWAEFGVLTAMELMQYDPQCKKTVCHLSYKDPRGRQVRSVLNAVYFKDRQGDNDLGYCKLACITHDLTLADELFKRVSNWKSSRIRAVGRNASGDSEKCCVVSYPHGLKKCVSVGQLLRREHRRDIYDAVTCEGCCGAPVFFFKKGVFTKNTVHVGKNQLRENQSTVQPA